MLLGALTTGLSLATDSGKVRLLSVADLKQNFDRYQILDSRDYGAFKGGHLPRSQHVNWKDWTEEKPGLWNAVFGDPAKWGKVSPDGEKIERKISALGLSNDTPVAIVGQPGEWGDEGRIAWNLLYWGIDEVALLDGGFPAWKAKYPTEIEKGSGVERFPGKFKIRLRPERRAELSTVKNALEKKTTLLDTRSPEEFAGEKLSAQKRGGHLPGATLVPVRSLYTAEGLYVGREELKKLIASDLKSPISYCVGGVRSALLALLIEARLGTIVANYDGSIWEWSRDETLPLEIR